MFITLDWKGYNYVRMWSKTHYLLSLVLTTIILIYAFIKLMIIFYHSKWNSKRLCHAKITIWRDNWKVRSPSPLRLPNGLVPWIVATKPSEVNRGRDVTLHPLSQVFNQVFYFRLSIIFGWQGWQQGLFAIVGKIPYTHSCHIHFFLGCFWNFIY